MRFVALFFLRCLQYLLNFLLWIVVLGLLARFGLQFHPTVERGSSLLIALLRQVADPAIVEVGSLFGLRWPSAALPIRLLPLGMAVPIWVVRVLFWKGLERARFLLHSRGPEPARKPREEPEEPERVTSDSWKAREQLLAQYRKIEKALKSVSHKRCTFLSMDVVGSTKMKTGESPTRIAASFQAYEEMLQKIFKQHRAWKQAWTPDGVTVCFSLREEAVSAAQVVLQSLEPFNAKGNRLRTPFRVRCGVNEGAVAIFDDSRLEAITDPVIDLAEHLQKRARENALWLSEEVYQGLSDQSGFRATNLVVDGQNAYEWSLEPTGEAAAARPAPATAKAAPAAAPVTPSRSSVPPPFAPAPAASIPLPAVKAPAAMERTVQMTPAAGSSVQRIGRYEILAELGRGAMGAVYKALDPQIARTVALKVIVTQNLSPEELRPHKERFYREAQAAGKLMHPGIVAIYDIGEDSSGAPYLVMEFVEGKTLERSLSRGEQAEPFTFSQRLTIAIEIAEALDYAHSRGVIHRDLKPANVLITPEGHAKITDFGIAKLVGAQATIGWQALGTPAFVSPEQLTGAPVDARSDIFSLGVVLYWMFTGERPFAGETVTAITYKVVHVMPPPARQLNWALPEELDKVLFGCLAKSPQRRYQTAGELAAELQALRKGRPQAARPPA